MKSEQNIWVSIGWICLAMLFVVEVSAVYFGGQLITGECVDCIFKGDL